MHNIYIYTYMYIYIYVYIYIYICIILCIGRCPAGLQGFFVCEGLNRPWNSLQYDFNYICAAYPAIS